jgi:hypothetical protein
MLADPLAVGSDEGQPDAFYRHTLVVLAEARVPFLLGGAWALAHYTGIVRESKDIDLFLRRSDSARAGDVLSAAGYQTEVPAPHWLGKVYSGRSFIDLIFGSGNGVCAVDDGWFAHAVEGEALGLPVRFCPVEEMIWSKAFIMERERYDGADVAHLVHACGGGLDWQRLLARFGPHWRVLLSHLVLFGFIYPDKHEAVPGWVLDDLVRRLGRERPRRRRGKPLCQGTLLSNAQYLVDRRDWGYRDARLQPQGELTLEEVARATASVSPADRRVRARRPRRQR